MPGTGGGSNKNRKETKGYPTDAENLSYLSISSTSESKKSEEKQKQKWSFSSAAVKPLDALSLANEDPPNSYDMYDFATHTQRDLSPPK
jgi:hypothetical protein